MTSRLLAGVMLALVSAAACSPTGPSGDAPEAAPALSFTVEGAGFENRAFGPALEDVTQHWVYDPKTKRTHIHISGSLADDADAWRVGIDFSVPRSGPGTYEADTSHRGIDRGFAVALADHSTGERIALIGVDSTLVLEPNAEDPDGMSGTFSGRFAVGHRTTGRDVLQTPPEQRAYAEVRDGRFRVRWKDTLHGNGQRWPLPPGS